MPGTKSDSGGKGSLIRCFNGHPLREGCLYLEEDTLLFICEGSWHFYHGEILFEAGPQQLVFLRKQVLVKHICRSPAVSCFLAFTLEHGVVQEFIRTARLQVMDDAPEEALLVHRPGAGLLACMGAITACFTSCGTMMEEHARVKLLDVLLCMVGSAAEQALLKRVLVPRATYYGNITSLMEAHFMDTISVGQLARLSGRSLSSFRRDFLAVYNMTPSRWIRHRRLEKACELLRGTRMSITEICYLLGFENIAHFSRVFKARFGAPPSIMRQGLLVQGSVE